MSATVGKRYDTAILFVHGMGEQQRGDTLTDMGEAVSEWLRRRLVEPSDAPTIRCATLRSDSQSTAAAAEAEITFGASEMPIRWLLKESRWADSFRPASFVETMLWGVSVGPWMMAYQANALRAGGPARRCCAGLRVSAKPCRPTAS